MGCISRRDMRCAELSVMAELSASVGAVCLVRAESLHGSKWCSDRHPSLIVGRGFAKPKRATATHEQLWGKSLDP